MARIALELIRGYDGNLVDIAPLDPKSLYQTTTGWCQVVDKEIVAVFTKKEILIAEVSE